MKDVAEAVIEIIAGVTYAEEHEMAKDVKISSFELEIDELQELIDELEFTFNVELEAESVVNMTIGRLIKLMKR